jgi:hypothetical protein
MKAILSLPIIQNNRDLPINMPTVENVGGFVIVTLNYQRIVQNSYLGKWTQFTKKIKKSDYNLNSITTELTNFVKWYYNI